MKPNVRLIYLSILLCSVVACANINEVVLAADSNETMNIKFTLKGMEQIRDPEFEKMLAQFLFFDEKNDYKQLYHFFSKTYLNNLPNIKTADEYVLFMEDSERSEIKYLEITRLQYQNSQYKVDIVYTAMAEGEIQKVQATYLFIQESTGWKYNGRD